MATTVANFDAALKQIYSGSNLSNTTLKRRPLLATLPKRSDFGGRNMPLPQIFGDPQSRSATFSKAIAAAPAAGDRRFNVQVEAFLLTRVSNYSIARVGAEAAEATRGDAMAFLASLKATIDGAMNALSNSLETQLFRTGTGSIGTVGVVAPGAVAADLTLSSVADVANFDVGMSVDVSTTDGSALEPVAGAVAVQIIAVNRSTGIITANAGWAATYPAPNLIAPGHFLYAEGDGQDGGATNTCVSGLGAWLPTTIPAANFFGVSRSVDSRLGGQYLNGGGGAIEETLIDAASMAARVGGNPDIAYMNHVDMRELIKNLHGSQQYQTVNATTHKGVVADIGFRSVAVQTDNGSMDVVAASKCPGGTGFVLEKDKWILATLGEPVKFLDLDGQRLLRENSTDEYTARMAFRGQLGCKAPIYNVKVDW